MITTMQSVCSNWPELLRMSKYILFCSNSIFFTNLISSHPTSKNLERSFQISNFVFSPFTSKILFDLSISSTFIIYLLTLDEYIFPYRSDAVFRNTTAMVHTLSVRYGNLKRDRVKKEYEMKDQKRKKN